MIYYLFIISINFIFCLGINSVSLPHNALEMSTSNSGIGNSQNIGINFASINNIKNTFSSSSINWYEGVKGGNISYKWGTDNHHYINLYTLSANEIELWGEIPDDSPIDFFDVHHISIGYGFGKNFSDKINFGIKNTIIYNQLYIDESFGYNIDLGVSYLYNHNIALGFSINQLGFEQNNQTNSTYYPLLIGSGLTININKLNSTINTDIIYNQELSDELTFKMSSITTFSQFFSFVLGYNYSNSKSEPSIGFSFKYRKIQLDYGVAFHTALGNPTIFSLKYNI